MKKWFQNKKEDEFSYDWDEMNEDSEYIDGVEFEGEYYEAEEGLEEGEYYEAEAGLEEGEYYEAEEGLEEDEYYEAEEDLTEEIEYLEEDGREKRASRSRMAARNPVAGFFAGIWDKFLNMNSMDRIIMATGVAVFVMALVTGGIYLSSKMVDGQISAFAEIGHELEGINLIGEQGLLAAADAQLALSTAASVVEMGNEPEQTEYVESEYSKDVVVVLNMSSIQKDLKIKFVNKNTNKLVSNVLFSVSITDPSGNTTVWTDDDKDGIIYRKDIVPGKYTVEVMPLEGEKYADYALPATKESIEVKKDIAYQKVDVSDEVKTESEINASVEDTKIQETPVESSLKDTVEWVESTAVGFSYIEVTKSNVTNPATVALSGRFMRLAASASVSESKKAMVVGESFTLTGSVSGDTVQAAGWSSSNTSVATVNGSGLVTAVAAGSATITYTATVGTVSANAVPEKLTATCTVTVSALSGGKITVDKASPAVAKGAAVDVQAAVSGFIAGRELVYTVTSKDTGIATAAVNGSGKVTITGVKTGSTTITVTANYKSGGIAQTAASAVITVTVAGDMVVSLDKTTATVYVNTPVTLKATVTNATLTQAVTATSSDTRVATVSVKDKEITVTGVAAGSATITVAYKENNVEVKATCAVTVKPDPKTDTTTPLKDNAGNVIYVLENGEYRKAVSADYYKAEKFFILGEAKYTGWQTLDGKVYFFDKAGKKVTGEQVIQGAKYNFASDGSLSVGSGTSGIDVSKWNGNIDWTAVKNSGISYVIIRCGYRGSSQGSLIVDPKYHANIKGANAAGLKVGVYFFTQAIDAREAVEEASMVLELVKNYKISYPIFLDVESSGGRADGISKETRTEVCKAFCETIRAAGYTSGIYANKHWFTTKIDAGKLSAYKIWLAQYASAPTYTGRYDLWQYSSTGRVSGISGNVDMNISYLGY